MDRVEDRFGTVISVDAVAGNAFGFAFVEDDRFVHAVRTQKRQTISNTNKIVFELKHYAVLICSFQLVFFKPVLLRIYEMQPFKIDVSTKVSYGESSIQCYRTEGRNDRKQ